MRYNSGFIGIDKTPTTNNQQGVHTAVNQFLLRKLGTWTGPPAEAIPTDTYFNYTTLLLPGDGSNGAQNNTFLDSSSNNLTITRNGDTTQGTFSPFSLTAGTWSNYFDGSGDYLTLPSNSAFAFGTGDFTAECWVYFISFVGANQALFDFRDGLDTTSLEMGVYSNNIPFLSNSSGGVLNGSFTFSVGTWYHIAFTRSGTSLNIWVNGTNVGSTSNSTNWTGNNCKIGGNPNGAENPNAYISNARVVKGTAVYTSAFTPPTAPLTAISGTSLLTCQSNRFIDNSSNAFTITVNGNTSVQAFSPFLPTAAYSAATVGGSGYVDGSGDYLTAPDTNDNFDFGSGEFSIEGWFYRTGGSRPLSKRNSGSTDGFLLQVTSAVTFYWSVSGSYSNISGGTINDASWNHIAICRSSDTWSIFLNGTRVATTSSATTIDASSSLLYIGIDGGDTGVGGKDWKGFMSNLRILKGSSAYDATQSSITVPTAPLTAITNTKLLLNFTNAGIIDNTAKNDLVTVGNAQISTAQSKFGGSSMYFDGTGDWLTSPATVNTSFGTGNFTVECWIYSTVNQNNNLIVSNRVTAVDTAWSLEFYNNGTGNNILNWHSGTTVIMYASTAANTSTWNHVAVVRSGTTTKIYLNGTEVASATDSRNYSYVGPVQVGYEALAGTSGIGYYNGYIDDLRITKGIARYTSNFTPPDALPSQ